MNRGQCGDCMYFNRTRNACACPCGTPENLNVRPSADSAAWGGYYAHRWCDCGCFVSLLLWLSKQQEERHRE